MSCSCCGGIDSTRGCIELEFNGITQTTPCLGIANHLEGRALQVKNYHTYSDTFGPKFFEQLNLMAARAGKNIASWSISRMVNREFVEPTSVRNFNASGDICIDNTFEYTGTGRSGNDVSWFLVDPSSQLVYLLIVEPSNHMFVHRNNIFGGQVTSVNGFWLAESSAAVNDLGDVTELNALSWTWEYYPPVDVFGRRTGQTEWFEAMLDPTAATITFGACAECEHLLDIVVVDSRVDVMDQLRELWNVSDAHDFSTNVVGLPSHRDALLGIYLSPLLDSPLVYIDLNQPLSDPYLYNSEIVVKSWIRRIPIGDVSVTYSGGGWTGGNPQTHPLLTKNDWDQMVSGGPLNGSSRTLSSRISETTSFPDYILRFDNADFYRGSIFGNGVNLSSSSTCAGDQGNPLGRTNVKLGGGTVVGVDNVGGMGIYHNTIGLNSIGYVPNLNRSPWDYQGVNPYSDATCWYGPQYDPGQCWGGRYVGEITYFERPTSSELWTRDWKHGQPSAHRPSTTSVPPGVLKYSTDTAMYTEGERRWYEAARHFCTAETSDGENWTITPMTVVQSWLPKYEGFWTSEKLAPVGGFDNWRHLWKCPENEEDHVTSSGETLRDRQSSLDTISTHTSSRLSYNVFEGTPVTVTAATARSAAAIVMRGLTDNTMTEYTPATGFYFQGTYLRKDGNFLIPRPDVEEEFPTWSYRPEYHMPPTGGNAYISDYVVTEMHVGDCEGANPCDSCECGYVNDIRIPCSDTFGQPFNILPEGACRDELAERFLNVQEGCYSTPPAATCEGCDGSKTVSFTVGGTSNNTCLGCTAVNQTYVTSTQFLGNGKLGAPTASELATYGAVCDGYMESFYVNFCGGSPMTNVTVQLRIHEDGLIKAAVETGMSSGLAIFSRTFTPGDYSPNCSISEAWGLPDSTTGGLCQINNQTLSISVS